MANTNVKPGRAPRAPKAPKAQPEAVEPKPETVEIEPKDVTVPAAPEVVPEPEITVPEQPKAPVPEPEPEVTPKPEPKPEAKPTTGTCTNVYLVQKGEKYNVYRGTKRLTRILVTLDKAKLVAAGYGENNPTIR